MTAFVIVVLVGIGALALDIGRLFVLHTQMENGVDAAALAAAYELDGGAGARERARVAARNVLEHNSNYTGDTLGEQLLGASQLPDPAFTFYSSIDPEPRVEATDDSDAGFVRVVLGYGDEQVDARRHINLFFLPVLKLLGLSSPYIDQAEATAQVAALAGTSIAICDYQPLMMCNPFETEGNPNTLWKNIPVGTQIKVKQHTGGGTITPGGFAWLDPMDDPDSDCQAESGANVGKCLFREQLAAESSNLCQNALIYPNTGQGMNEASAAINVRFGVPPGFDDLLGFLDGSKDWPAPVVIDYPRDECMNMGTNCLAGAGDRFGQGDWSGYPTEVDGEGDPQVMPTQLSREAYIDAYHSILNTSHFSGLTTRADFYRRELNLQSSDTWEDEKPGDTIQWYIPTLSSDSTIDVSADGIADAWECKLPEDQNAVKCAEREQAWFNDYVLGTNWDDRDFDGHITDGTPRTGGVDLSSVGAAKRRVIHILVANCQTSSIGGTEPQGEPMLPQDGFAKIFLTEHMRSAPAESGVNLLIEWMGAFDLGDNSDKIQRIVQLYDTN